MAAMFFDDHPEFLETSTTANQLDRLNLRHVALIEQNADVLKGRSVVDIASHDGRWSFAALEAGASHVIGIEGRRSLVLNARETLRTKGVSPDRYRFVRGDVHQRIHRPEIVAEVVMCFGFLYHTARYVELFSGIASTGAEYVLVDTRVIPGDRPIVEMHSEGIGNQALAIRDRYTLGKRNISATPSEAAVLLMLDAAGYELDQRTDWEALLAEHPNAGAVTQYADGTRVSFRCRRKADA